MFFRADIHPTDEELERKEHYLLSTAGFLRIEQNDMGLYITSI
jgi:hypothetical protein